MLLKVATRRGKLHHCLHDPCVNLSSVKDDVQLDRHTAVDAAAIGKSGTSKKIQYLLESLLCQCTSTTLQAIYVTRVTNCVQ